MVNPGDAGSLRWAVVDPSTAEKDWDRWLLEFGDHHIRQSYAWAAHKAGRWRPLFTALFHGPTPVALGLCLMRRAPLSAATLLWINGGPVFMRSRPEEENAAALRRYLEGLQEHLRAMPNPVARVCMNTPAELPGQLLLRQSGFTRALSPLNTGLTYVLDLGRDLEALRGDMDRKWRNQLKNALGKSPRVDIGRERGLLERTLPLHNALCARKGLSGGRLRLEDLEGMVRALGERIVFLVASVDGRDGCAASLWTFGGKAYLALAAADDWGLRHNLPNALYWRAVEHLKQSGCRTFDLAGVDPRDNWGVFNFKRGLGGRPLETLGEWDWAPSDWTRRFFNLALWGARGRLA